MTDDTEYFMRLVGIKRPKAIVCLGRAASEAAYKTLAGKRLEIPKGSTGFYDFIASKKNGRIIELCRSMTHDSAFEQTERPRFYAMAHSGGMGAANRKSKRGGGKDVVDDWTFLSDLLEPDPSLKAGNR